MKIKPARSQLISLALSTFCLSLATICLRAAAAAPGATTLRGGVETTAVMPGHWTGLWSGAVKLKALAGQVEDTRESAVKLTLELEASKNGRAILKRLCVSSDDANQTIAGQVESDGIKGSSTKREMASEEDREDSQRPDIIFQHNGQGSSLTILPGGSIEITGAGAGTASGGEDGKIDCARPGKETLNYNGKIIFGGKTVFRGKYFKSDEAISIAPANTTIESKRIEIAGQTIRHDGPVQVEGNRASGFLIRELSTAGSAMNDSGASSAWQDTGVESFQILGSNQSFLKNELKNIAADAVGENASVPLLDGHGNLAGYQQTSVKYTSISVDRMLVEMQIKNYSLDQKLTKEFALSGYLDRLR